MEKGQILGWMLVAVGAFVLWLALKAMRDGSVTYGDKVTQRTYTRAGSPGSFWAGVAFYLFLGAGLIVAGALAVFGVLA